MYRPIATILINEFPHNMAQTTQFDAMDRFLGSQNPKSNLMFKQLVKPSQNHPEYGNHNQNRQTCKSTTTLEQNVRSAQHFQRDITTEPSSHP